MSFLKYYQVLPAAATFSKDPRAFGVQPEEDWIGPLDGGYRCWVWDEGGRVFIDWVMGLGATVLGHGHPEWQRRFEAHRSSLLATSLPHRLERLAAERLASLFQGVFRNPQVRFVKTGSDALAAAVRLARRATGRMLVLTNSYHGWHDWFIAGQPPAHGIPGVLAGCVAELKRDPGPAAAVVTEQLPGEGPPQRPPVDALWILDEVVTCFRYGIPGWCARLETKPDIVCLGKALGNGLPIAAVVAERELMSYFSPPDPVFVSSTSFGEPISLAGALATMEVVNEEMLQHNRELGVALMRGEEEIARRYPGYSIRGDPERSVSFLEDRNTDLVYELLRRGIIKNRPNFPSFGHSQQIVERTLDTIVEVLEWLQNHPQSSRPTWQLFPSRSGPAGRPTR